MIPSFFQNMKGSLFVQKVKPSVFTKKSVPYDYDELLCFDELVKQNEGLRAETKSYTYLNK